MHKFQYEGFLYEIGFKKDISGEILKKKFIPFNSSTIYLSCRENLMYFNVFRRFKKFCFGQKLYIFLKNYFLENAIIKN